MKLLICLDKSASTEKVLLASKNLAHRYGQTSQIKIVHIIDETIARIIEGPNNELEVALRKRSTEIRLLSHDILQMKIEYIEKYGNPKTTIVELLNGMEYDMVIVGSHGRTRLKHVLVGSFSEIVLKISCKPVMVVPTLK
jgi:nucleotide-binding universal stress UspA family protein